MRQVDSLDWFAGPANSIQTAPFKERSFPNFPGFTVCLKRRPRMRAMYAWLGMTVIFLAQFQDIWAADPRPVPEIRFNLLTLPEAMATRERMQQSAQIFLDRASLRSYIQPLSQRYRFSFWIDRRVDADKPLSLNLSQTTVADCLQALAQQCNAQAGLIENIVVIAPADRLAAMQYAAVRLHDQLSRQEGASDHKTQLRPLEWPLLTTPSELAAQIAGNWGFAFPGKLPHDLLNAGQLQPCTVATQLTLLLGGFDQCVAGRGLDSLRLINLPEAAAWQATYDNASVSQNQRARVTQEFPDAAFTLARSTLTLVGPTEAHVRLLTSAASATRESVAGKANPREPRSKGSDPLAKQRYTIQQLTPQPIRGVIMALSSQLGMQVEWDPAVSPAQLQKLVTLDEKEAQLDELLARLGKQSDLQITRRGKTVIVTAGRLDDSNK